LTREWVEIIHGKEERYSVLTSAIFQSERSQRMGLAIAQTDMIGARDLPRELLVNHLLPTYRQVVGVIAEKVLRIYTHLILQSF
jgi:hypothetical protein